jgi:hypothetical protein
MPGFSHYDVITAPTGTPKYSEVITTLAGIAYNLGPRLDSGIVTLEAVTEDVNVTLGKDLLLEGNFESDSWASDADDASLGSGSAWAESGTTDAIRSDLTATPIQGVYSAIMDFDSAATRLTQNFRVPAYLDGKSLVLTFTHREDSATGAPDLEWAVTNYQTSTGTVRYWDDGGAAWTTETWNGSGNTTTNVQESFTFTPESPTFKATAGAGTGKTAPGSGAANRGMGHSLIFRPDAADALRNSWLDKVAILEEPTTSHIKILAGERRTFSVPVNGWRLAALAAGAGTLKMDVYQN